LKLPELPKLGRDASPTAKPGGVGTKLGKTLAASAGSEIADAGDGRLLGILLVAVAILAAAVALRVLRRRRAA
jgi:hypothetical protein